MEAAKPQDPQISQASLSELVQQLSEQTSRLAHQEVELAKAELAAKGKRAESAPACSGVRACSASMRSVP